MLGLKVLGKSGVAQFDSDSKNMFRAGERIVNLPAKYELQDSGHSNFPPWLLRGWSHNITLPSNTKISAFNSNTWIKVDQDSNKINIQQPGEDSSGTATVHYFIDNSGTSNGNYGLSIFGANSFSLASASLLKVIDVFNLPPNTQSWSYDAPVGKKIAVIIGGGNSRWSERKWKIEIGKTMTELYFRTPNNSRVEISFRETYFDRRLDIYGQSGTHGATNWQKMTINVVIIDITGL